MDLGEALIAILLFSVAGIVAAQWQGRRRRSEPRVPAGIGATILGFIFGGIAGGVLGFGLGELIIVFAGQARTDGETGDEIAQFFVGPGLIVGAFAGAYIGRWMSRRMAIRRQSKEDW